MDKRELGLRNMKMEPRNVNNYQKVAINNVK